MDIVNTISNLILHSSKFVWYILAYGSEVNFQKCCTSDDISSIIDEIILKLWPLQ